VKIDTGYLIGCDIGQASDPTAIVIAQRWQEVEWQDREGGALDFGRHVAALSRERRDAYGYTSRILPSYDVVHAERLPLDTPYPDEERVLKDLVRRPELQPGRYDGTTTPMVGEHRAAPRLVVDATGVGAPVLDHLRAAGLAPVGILIHGGDAVTRGRWVWRVPKRDLVGAVSVRLQNHSLRFTQAGPFAGILRQELLNFHVKIDPVTAHDSYSAWREHQHDDLVLATAIALWWGERSGGLADNQPFQAIYAKM
jgi:hypothetical protein